MVSRTAQPPPRGADEQTVVHFTGDRVSLDENTVRQIREELLALADETDGSELLFDFGNVEYVATAALAALVSLRRKLLTGGRHVTIYNLAPHIHEVFAVTRLDELLDLRPAGPAPEPVPQARHDGFPAGVLVVDDEEAVRSVIQIGLYYRGFEAWVAAGGDRAVELYRRHLGEIAVVLLDVHMPGMDGPRTLAALQQLSPTVRCCFMTANPAPYTEESLLRLGAVRVFLKPVAIAEIVGTLNRLTGRSPRRRRHRWIETPQ
jgi:anti-anti-sigma factor